MSQNFEELYNNLKQEYELSKKDNDEICKEYESTIEILSDSVESMKKEKANLEQKLSKYELESKTFKKEKESLLNKNKDKISDIQNLNKQNDKLTNEVKKLKEDKALFDSKIVSLENDNEHLNNKIREYEVLTEDLENQLESALEENITLQTEFETYKQTTGEQLIRKDDEIRDIKNDLLNKDKFIQRLQTRANNGLLVKNIQKNFMESKLNERRRLTLFPGISGEDNDLMKFQKNFNIKGNKNNLNYETEKIKNNTINNNINKINSLNANNMARNSVFMSGFGSLSRLMNKKEELNKKNNFNKINKVIINSPNNIDKNKYFYQKGKENNSGNKNTSSQKSIFSEKSKLSSQIDEISEKSEKEEIKIIDFNITQESKVEYIGKGKNKNNDNNNVDNENKEAELLKIIKKMEKEKGIILEDLQKILERIRKRKEKLVNTKKTNQERIKNLKQN